MSLSRWIYVMVWLASSGFSPLFAQEALQLKTDDPQLVLADRSVSTDDSLNVNDLGFTQSEIQSDLTQNQLNTREDMLHIHQILGLVTAVPMLTEFVLGLVTANNVSNGSTDTTLHTTLGLTTAALYGATAAFAILAPKPKNEKREGHSAIHEDLVWVHLPLMILVPLVGDMINDRIANHQPIGNLGVVHGVMATTLVVSYMTSLTVMTF